MAPQKSPAFQFYPKDFNSGTATFSLQEVGAYIRLLNHQWDTGSVPDDERERARILGCAKSQEITLWKKVGQKFVLRGGVYVNERLEGERQKQIERRQRLSDAGKLGGRPTKATDKPDESQGFPEAKATDKPDERLTSSSSSSFSKEPVKNTGSDAPVPAKPLISGQSNPRDWGRIHGNHVAGFCDWVCLPDFVFEEFRAKSPGPEYVKGWAARIRQEWEGQTIGEDGLKFWRARWSDSHRTPVAQKPIRIQEILDKEAARKAGRAS